ncbi:hypothetical protein A3Q56_03012 [Intoshia linei]|uniref:Uncharacterized protein n=1 Tax=Intoshia linei TaxID=1819745 RepID=A0A177B6Z1_9BILA|nr:hypothetical protein A3Q56_03012 [Intoshia linei]
MKNVSVICDIRLHKGLCWCVAWHHSGKVLASSGQDTIVYLYSFEDEKIQLIRKLTKDEFTRTVRCVNFSPDGSLLSATSFDGQTAIWKNFDNVSIVTGSGKECKGGSWSQTGDYMATCEKDKNVWIWDVIDDEIEYNCVINDHKDDVKTVEWIPNNDVLVSAGSDKSIRMYCNSNDDWEIVSLIEDAHDSIVWSLCFDKSGKNMISVGQDGYLKIWTANCSLENWTNHYKFNFNCPVYSVSLDASNNKLVVALGPYGISILETALEKIDANIEIDSDTGCFSETTPDYLLKLKNIILESRIDSKDCHKLMGINCVKFHPIIQSIFATAGDDGRVVIMKCK